MTDEATTGHEAAAEGNQAKQPSLDEVIAMLKQVSTATITTQLMRRGLRSAWISGVVPLNKNVERMVGEAFTLRYIPAREDIDTLSVFQDYDHPQRQAIETAPVGSVLVIDARGRRRAGTLGNILATRFMRRGGSGIVTDGPVRDVDGFGSLSMPVFSSGAAATTNLAEHHAVDFQLPIGCGEVAVYPGDLIVGDGDGVVCIPRHLAHEVAVAALEQEHLEEFILSEISHGAPLRGTYPPDSKTLEKYQATRSA